MFSLFIQLHIPVAKVPVPIGSRSGGEKNFGSGSYQKGPDPQPCLKRVRLVDDLFCPGRGVCLGDGLPPVGQAVPAQRARARGCGPVRQPRVLRQGL